LGILKVLAEIPMHMHRKLYCSCAHLKLGLCTKYFSYIFSIVSSNILIIGAILQYIVCGIVHAPNTPVPMLGEGEISKTIGRKAEMAVMSLLGHHTLTKRPSPHTETLPPLALAKACNGR
jgi:hypothetical protein